MSKTSGLFIVLIVFSINLFAQPDIKKDWKANWITYDKTNNKSNSWTIYRKSFYLSKEPNFSVIANIATDSKYWLYINDKLVVFEGGLKRGPTPKDTYYDEVEISEHLKQGKNTIAILVWFWNRDGFCHKNSGKSGLLFEANFDNRPILSDESWKVAEHKAFGETKEPFPNYRLPEYNIHFDARQDIFGWYKNDFDDSKFESATICGKAGGPPWNALWKRPIPLWKDSGIIAYENDKVWPNEGADKIVSMKLPRNITITPYMEIDAPAGLLIDIRTDNYKGGSEYNVRAEYITKDGVQSFETPGYLNGHEVHYHIPEGVKILDLKYRETRYDSDYNGFFESDNEDLNTLWIKSRNTMNINLRDAIQDPDRERSQWWGDAVIILGEIMYSADYKGMKIIKKAISNLVEWQKPDGVLFSPIPAGEWEKELPSQMLAAVGKYGFYKYFEYTNDSAFVKYIYPHVRRYMSLWKMDQNNLVVHRKGGWAWYDWGDKIDTALLDNAWYYMALDGTAKMADIAGFDKEAEAYRNKMKLLKSAFTNNFWKGDFFCSDAYQFAADDRGNGLAVVAGLVSQEQWEKMRPILDKTFNSGPYLEKYVLEAYFLMNDGKAGVERMLHRYDNMIKSPLTTLWEGWEINSHTYGGGSYNHGWSGGPLTLMSQYIAGLSPGKAGFQSVNVFPQPSGLKTASMGAETIAGYMKTSFYEKEDKFELNIAVPKGSYVKVGIPKFEKVYQKILLNGTLIWDSGKPVSSPIASYSDENAQYIIFNVASGNLKFEAIF